MSVVEVRNGSGLRFSVLPDRGLDIGEAELRGFPLAWISRNGLVAPSFMETTPLGFLRSFSGGLLTTCGLTNVGLPEEDGEGDYLPFHGRISHTPAENWTSEDRWEEGRLVFKVTGRVRECRVYAENLVLERTISTAYGENTIHVEDTIRNEGNRSWPLMLFYHINFGFPLVDDGTKYITRAGKVWALNDAAREGNGNHQDLTGEMDESPFQCFVHEMPTDGRRIYAALVNETLGIGASLEYDPAELSFFNQWNVMEMQDYVAAFEPGNCMPEGRSAAKEKKQLVTIDPGEEVRFSFTLGFTENEETIRQITDSLGDRGVSEA
jgi:hypothetical protein